MRWPRIRIAPERAPAWVPLAMAAIRGIGGTESRGRRVPESAVSPLAATVAFVFSPSSNRLPLEKARVRLEPLPTSTREPAGSQSKRRTVSFFISGGAATQAFPESEETTATASTRGGSSGGGELERKARTPADKRGFATANEYITRPLSFGERLEAGSVAQGQSPGLALPPEEGRPSESRDGRCGS